MNTLNSKSNSLHFFDRYIADAKLDFRTLKTEHQQSEFKEKSFNSYLIKLMLQTQEEFINYLIKKVYKINNKEDLDYFVKKTITHTQSILQKVIAADTKNLASNILKITLNKINNIYKQHERTEIEKISFHIHEVETIANLLTNQNLHLHIIENEIMEIVQNETVNTSFYSKFIENKKEHYQAIEHNTKRQIAHLSHSLKQLEFKEFILRTHQFLKQMNHPEILKKTIPEQVRSAHETEIALRQEIQIRITSSLIQFIENKYKKILIEKNIQTNISKVQINRSRTELTVILSLLKESNFFFDIKTDSQLARFIENTFTDQNNRDLKNIKVLISQIKNNEKNIANTLKEVLMFTEQYCAKINA